jgi:hypothetical protein
MKRGTINVAFYNASDEDMKNLYPCTKLGLPFQVSDLLSESGGIKKVIEINSILVDKESRMQGFGTEMLKSLCCGNDDTIIIAGASALMAEFKDEPTREQYNELFENLTKFYTSNNFDDVTRLFGTYDGSTKRTFLYKNKAGESAIKARQEFLEKDK